MDLGTLLLGLGVVCVFVGQGFAISAWVVLSRITLEVVTKQTGMMAPFLLTFGMAAATKRTTLGAAIIAESPEDGPKYQRRFRRGLLLTLLGVAIAFGGFWLG